jgi:hypothetical protein
MTRFGPISHLGANHSLEMVARIGKTAKLHSDVERNMCKQLKAALQSRSHTKCSDEKDFLLVLQQLVAGQVLIKMPERSCNAGSDVFVNFKRNSLLAFIDENKIKYARGKWMF